MRFSTLLATAPALLAGLSLGLAAPRAGQAVHATPELERAALANLRLLRLSGEEVRFDQLVDNSVWVVAFSGVDCPISNKYAPRLERLSREWAARGVRFLGVNANPQDTRTAIADELEELGVTFPVVRDFRQELARALDAKTTTATYVFAADGSLAYRGAIDDQYALGASKPAPTRTWLVNALEAVLAGEAPATTETEAPGCKVTLLDAAELPEAVTWSHDIAPLLRSNCEVCHRPGQVAPFALQTYDQASGWAEMIAEVVEEERMPPWNAHERFDGVFVNERRLKQSEKAKIRRWVADGMPRGNPDEAPKPAEWPEGWTIGEPDAIFSMQTSFETGKALPPEGFEVPREGTVEYMHFTVETDYPEDRWIQAMEVRPGAADVVHHVLITVSDPDGSPLSRARAEDGIEYLAVAVPGDTPSIYPDGYAKKLPKGATLIFQLHYTPNGKERFDRSSLALIFAEEEPYFEVVTNAVVNRYFEIPPGAADHELTADLELIEDTGVIALFPHMHTRGKDFRYLARYPDGTEEELLFTDYDFNWQESYIYPDPKPLPTGTVIECTAHFDNSPANPNNPDPTDTVRWGDQTWEEMFIGYFDFVRPIE